eukprot:COSAG04_NODE_1045_length_8578_cov_9.398396_9_plen_145_part_00
MSVLNFNMELARPECTFDIDFRTRQVLTLASPLVIIALLVAFLAIQLMMVTAAHLCKAARRAKVHAECTLRVNRAPWVHSGSMAGHHRSAVQRVRRSLGILERQPPRARIHKHTRARHSPNPSLERRHPSPEPQPLLQRQVARR